MSEHRPEYEQFILLFLNASEGLYFDYYYTPKGLESRGDIVHTAWLDLIILAITILHTGDKKSLGVCG